MGIRVLVCGGRNYWNYARIAAALDDEHEDYGIDLIIEGGARGADACALAWALDRGVSFETFHADWKGAGRSAGHIRNYHMLCLGKPDLVRAFPGGPGTSNMVYQAERWPDVALTVVSE